VLVTAAHCLIDPSRIVGVKVGVQDWRADKAAPMLRVASVLQHPDYALNAERSGKYLDSLGDIGLVFLETALPDSAPTLRLAGEAGASKAGASKAGRAPGAALTALGYGVTKEGGADMSRTLREVGVKLIPRAECVALLNGIPLAAAKAAGAGKKGAAKLTAAAGGKHARAGAFELAVSSAAICAGALGGGRDSCSGDSGGPLVAPGADAASDVAVGLVSFGDGCGRANTPAGYTNVIKYVGWVEAELAQAAALGAR
jgi:trypsin